MNSCSIILIPVGTNLLMCTVTTEFYSDVVAKKTKDEVIDDLYDILKNMYGDKAVKPEDILIPDWATNPLFQGTYSNPKVGKLFIGLIDF